MKNKKLINKIENIFKKYDIDIDIFKMIEQIKTEENLRFLLNNNVEHLDFTIEGLNMKSCLNEEYDITYELEKDDNGKIFINEIIFNINGIDVTEQINIEFKE